MSALKMLQKMKFKSLKELMKFIEVHIHMVEGLKELSKEDT